MEEILASIRRIIADDQAEKPEVAETVPQPQNDDVLDLAEIAQTARAPQAVRRPDPEPKASVSSFPMPDLSLERDEIDFADLGPRMPRTDGRDPLEAAVEREALDRLVSPTTDDSVGRAFNLLSRTVLGQNPRTLEDLVVEMLRPMLREWLDDNLPGMVERLVRAEIERVARGR